MKKHDVSCGCKEKQYKPNCNQEDDADGTLLTGCCGMIGMNSSSPCDVSHIPSALIPDAAACPV